MVFEVFAVQIFIDTEDPRVSAGRSGVALQLIDDDCRDLSEALEQPAALPAQPVQDVVAGFPAWLVVGKSRDTVLQDECRLRLPGEIPGDLFAPFLQSR